LRYTVDSRTFTKAVNENLQMNTVTIANNLVVNGTISSSTLTALTNALNALTARVNVLEGNATDNTAPVITLTGGSTVSVDQHSTFTEPGFTATDNVDGTITSSVTVSDSVNTAVAGSYTLTYSVSDTAGNSTSVVRSVTVTATTLPDLAVTWNGSALGTVDVGDYVALTGSFSASYGAGVASYLPAIGSTVAVSTSGNTATVTFNRSVIAYGAFREIYESGIDDLRAWTLVTTGTNIIGSLTIKLYSRSFSSGTHTFDDSIAWYFFVPVSE
jgi:hypothetical protein